MGIVKIASDLDGTVTRELELDSFFQAYSSKFLKLTSMPSKQYLEALQTVRHDMETDPLKYGHRHNGIFSGPTKGDPIGANTVTHIEFMRRILRGTLSEIDICTALRTEDDVQRIKEDCYQAADPQRRTFFRDGAAEYLNALAHMFPCNTAIASNSREDSIARKLSRLDGLEVQLHIIGLTFKMNVESENGQIQPPGFPVPINPDRPTYLDKLREFHPDLNEIAVIGDNFFLDVAPVLLNGGYGVLIESEATQGYEVPYLLEHPHGHFAKNFDDALAFIERHRASEK